MSEDSSGRSASDLSTASDAGKIDITGFTDSFLRGFRRLWWLVLLLMAAGAAMQYFHTSSYSSSSCTAEATVAVTSVANTDDSNSKADQMASVFPYIVSSGVLNDVIQEDLGLDYIPGSIHVTALDGSNLITVRVTGSDPEQVYAVLQSVIKNYPTVAQYVVGQTELQIVDDSGVPAVTGFSSVTHGSARRGAMYGLAVGIAMILVYISLARTIRDEKDLKRTMNVPYLGTLPIYRRKKRRHRKSGISILEHNVQQDYLEAIRLVRTRIQRKLEEKGGKVVMVTSSVPSEGKSTVASNLAVSLAGEGKTVFLVDCDFRNPSVQRTLNIKGSYPGLEKILGGQAELSDALYSYEEKRGLNLYVIPGPKNPGSSHTDLLGSEAMKSFLDQLRNHADYIVLDTPPSGLIADAMLLVQNIDLAVYVVGCDFARTSVIVQGVSELQESGAPFGGCVLNGGKRGSGGYAKSYSYGKNYGYTSRY